MAILVKTSRPEPDVPLGSANFAQFVCVSNRVTLLLNRALGIFLFCGKTSHDLPCSSPIIFHIFLYEFPPQSGSSTLTCIFVHLSVVYSQTAEYREGFKYRHIAVREGVPITLQQKIQIMN